MVTPDMKVTTRLLVIAVTAVPMQLHSSPNMYTDLIPVRQSTNGRLWWLDSKPCDLIDVRSPLEGIAV